MEVTIDHFIIEWIFECKDKLGTALNILNLIRRKCHKIVFTKNHLEQLHRKLHDFEKEFRNDHIARLIIGLFRDILTDTKITTIRERVPVEFIETIPKDDHVIIESAMRIGDSDKILVTSDEKLIAIVNNHGSKYRLKGISPSQALELLE